LSCGRPLDGVEIRIVDAAGEPLPPRQVGEIVCRTPQVMKGYWSRPEETATAVRGGWFHTGDAGYLDDTGFLYIYDRVKDMIVSGGENIYPAEVESALYGHPDIADVALIGVPDERWGEAVKAIVVLKPGRQASAAEIIAYARERIASGNNTDATLLGPSLCGQPIDAFGTIAARGRGDSGASCYRSVVVSGNGSCRRLHTQSHPQPTTRAMAVER
jgi:acyl-CoA synthetase (AMP-forming)/AMP-acid ligase II